MSEDHCSQPEFYRGHTFRENERRMRMVVMITAVMMVAEIVGGVWLGSMALLADGFHMGTHVGALGISSFAYFYARRYARDPRFSFGTGKVGDLAGYSSAIILGIVALYVFAESVARFWHPVTIIYDEAIALAVLGLGVNVASAMILHGAHGHHDHDHGHDHDHEHHDHAHKSDNNFRSAYFHILADALTSVTAIVALGFAWRFGWQWLDPLTGAVGALVILSWAWSLMRDTTVTLLDHRESDLGERIKEILAGKSARINDLHIWRVGPGAYAAIIALTSNPPATAESVREWLKPLNLAHVTVEIN